jgi:signal transduction histidine kinase
MTGILAASAILLLVLSLTLWYLVRTLMQLRTLDEMKTDFTNNMTHELKTPISVAYAAGDALLHFGSLPPKAQSYLTVSQEQLIRLSGMVEQILAMSTERRRAIPLQLADVGLRKVAEPLMEMHRLKSQRPVDFTLDIEPDDLTLRADSDHLTAMLSNLIDNAIKYSRGERAEVTIRGRRNVVEVIDHGIGIPHDKLPYVFDRFYRVPQGDRHDVKGYGLGLYYVRQTMLRHGGDVTIKSTPGQGTTVKLQFDGTD